jgi:hypothetical protein
MTLDTVRTGSLVRAVLSFARVTAASARGRSTVPTAHASRRPVPSRCDARRISTMQEISS